MAVPTVDVAFCANDQEEKKNVDHGEQELVPPKEQDNLAKGPRSLRIRGEPLLVGLDLLLEQLHGLVAVERIQRQGLHRYRTQGGGDAPPGDGGV